MTMWEVFVRQLKLACRSLFDSGKGARLQVLTLTVCQLPLLCLVSVFDATVWKRLPFPEPGQLYFVQEGMGAIGKWEEAGLEPGQLRGIEGYGSFSSIEGTFSGADGSAQRVKAAVVSDGFFETLRPPLQMGSWPSKKDRGQARRAVISESFRQQQFRGGSEVLGRPFVFNGIAMEVSGVLREGTVFPEGIEICYVRADRAEGAFRGAIVAEGLVRLKPGVGSAAAEAEMDAAIRNSGVGGGRAQRSRLQGLADYLDEEHAVAMRVSLGVAFALFLVGIVNVVTILSYEMVSGERATAIRLASGATPGELLRELSARQAILAGIAWALALGLAPGITRLVAWMVGLPGEGVPHFPSLRAMAAVLALSVVSGAVTPLWQTWFVWRVNLSTALQQNAQSISDNRKLLPVRRALAAAQVAITTALVALAGIALSQYLRSSNTSLGFETKNVWTSEIQLDPERFASEESRRLAVLSTLQELRAALPEMQVGAINYLPLDRRQSILLGLQPEGSKEQPVVAGFRVVSGDYFEAMGIAYVSGHRLRQMGSMPGKCRLAINEELARRLPWGLMPIGKKASIAGFREGCEILAVVKSVRHGGPEDEAGPEFYMLHADMPSPFMSLAMRGDVPESQVREAVWRASAGWRGGGPRYGVERLQEKFDALTAPQRKRTLTILAVSLLALLLTQVGLYGSMIRDLHFRAKRLAIEQALGASGRQLLVPFLAKRVGELGLSAAAGCLLALSVVRCWPMGIGTLERADYWGAGGMAMALLAGCALFSAAALWPLLRREPGEILRSNP